MAKPKTFKSKFTTKLTADIDIGGKVLTLTRPLIFWDSAGKRHVVPTGTKANGASFDADKRQLKWLGRFIMFFVGAPLGDFWAWASVVHDYLCCEGKRLGLTSQRVHDIFHEGMIVCIYRSAEPIKDTKKRERQIRKDKRTARKFHWAVSKWGPSW